MKSGGDPRAKKIEEERAAERKRKEEAKKEEEEKKALFRPVMTQKVESGMFSKSESVVNSVWSYFSYVLMKNMYTIYLHI